MSPLAKLHLWSALYCGALISLNWTRTTNYARTEGLTSHSTAPVGLALLLSVAIFAVLGCRVLKFFRRHLEVGEKVRVGRWIESWSVVIYALPLLWPQVTTSVWVEPDGALATSVGGFGHAFSAWIFLFAIAGLLLAQIGIRLAPRKECPMAI